MNYIEEMCTNCNEIVTLPPYLGIYKCPKCGEFIIACEMCDDGNCEECAYSRLIEKYQWD